MDLGCAQRKSDPLRGCFFAPKIAKIFPNSILNNPPRMYFGIFLGTLFGGGELNPCSVLCRPQPAPHPSADPQDERSATHEAEGAADGEERQRQDLHAVHHLRELHRPGHPAPRRHHRRGALARQVCGAGCGVGLQHANVNCDKQAECRRHLCPPHRAAVGPRLQQRLRTRTQKPAARQKWSHILPSRKRSCSRNHPGFLGILAQLLVSADLSAWKVLRLFGRQWDGGLAGVVLCVRRVPRSTPACYRDGGRTPTWFC